MAENVSGTAHSGAHVDALAHMTIGEDDHWYGGGNAREHLGDRGPSVGDGSKLPPFIRRGVLLDVPGYLDLEALASHQPVDAAPLPGGGGPSGGDGSTLPPFIRRGVLLDVPGYLALEALASHQPVDADQLQAVAAHQGV